MAVIGSAWVEIRGITDRLDKDIKDSINKSLKGVGKGAGDSIADEVSKGLENVDTSGLVNQMSAAGRDIADAVEKEFKGRISEDAFDVVPDMDSSALRRVRDQLEDLKDDYEDIEANVVPDLNALAARYVSSRLSFLSRTRFVRFVTTLDAKSFATVLAALSGARMIGNTLTNLWDRFKNVDKMILGIASWGSLLAYASGWITMFVGDVLSLIVSIGRIAGAVMPLPGILAGLAIGIGATVAVMKDFGNVLPEVGQEFSKIREMMSQNFWGMAEAPIRRLTDVLLPTLRKGLEGTATSLGTWFSNISDSARKHLVDEIPAMFDNMNKSIQLSARYTDQYARIIEILGRNGSEYLPRLATWFGNISTRFASFLSRAERSGELKRWADQGIENLGYLGSAIWGIGRIFYEIGVIAEEAGGSTLKSFSGALNSVADVIGREPFRSQMTKVFQSANDMILEISERSGPAVKQFFNSFADVVASTFNTMGTVIGTVVNELAKALTMQGLQQGFLSMITGIGDGLMGLSQYLPVIGRAFGELLSIIGQMGSAYLPTLGRALEALSHLILAVAPAVSTIISALSGFLNILLSISPAVTVAGAILGALALRFAFIREQTALMSTRFALAGLAIQNFARAARTSLATARIDAQLTGVSTAMVTMRVATAGIRTAMMGAVVGIQAVGTALKAAFISNPIGIALIALTTLIGHFATKNAEAKSRVEQLQATLDLQTGAITEQTRETVILNAAQSGMLQNARDLGLNIGQVVDAMMLNKGAMSDVNAELDRIISNGTRRIGQGRDTVTTYTDEARAAMEFKRQLEGTNGELDEAVGLGQLVAEANASGATAADDHADAQDELATELDYTNALLSTQIGSLKEIIQLQADASNAILSHRENQRGLEAAYDDASEAFSEYLETHSAGTHALDDGTAAGRRNAAAIDNVVKKTWDLVDSTDGYAEKVAVVEAARAEFIELATTILGSRSEATALADELGLIPANVDVEVELLDTHARHNLNGLLVDINKTTGVVSIDGNPVPATMTMGELIGDINQADGTVDVNGNPVPAELTVQEFMMMAAGEQVDITLEAFLRNREIVSEYAETIPELEVPMDITPRDEPAHSALAGIRTAASATPATMNVDSRTGLAMGGVNMVLGFVRRATPTLNLGANPAKANNVRAQTVNAVNRSNPQIKIGGNPAQGNSQLAGLRSRVSGSVSRIMIGARDSAARGTLSTVLGSIRSRTANISIGAINRTYSTVSGIISSISSRVATITVRARQALGFADGGIMPSVKAYANGGVENHRAQIARAGGPIRMWAEPETGGEAYIPLAMSKRLRSKKILEEVARMFGYSVIPAIQAFNNGGFSSGQPISSRNASPSATITRGRNEVVLAPESVDAVVEGMVRGLWPTARAATLLEDWEKMGNTRKRMRGVR